MNSKPLKELIENARLERGLSVEDLARAAEIPLELIQEFQKGNIRPGNDFLNKVDSVLKIGLEKLREARSKI